MYNRSVKFHKDQLSVVF